MPCGQGYAKTGLRARVRVEPYPLTGSVEDPTSERYLDQGILNYAIHRTYLLGQVIQPVFRTGVNIKS